MVDMKLEADWTANLRNGENLNSKMFPDGFLEIPQEKRDQIVSLHFNLGSKKFTISRKVRVNAETIYLPGFFYHIKAGVKRIFKSDTILPDTLPFVEERFGFCYNSKGDAMYIMIDHMGYWREKRRIGEKIQHAQDEILKIENRINYLPKAIKKFPNKDFLKQRLDMKQKQLLETKSEMGLLMYDFDRGAIRYITNIDSNYPENIVEKKVAHALFGKLEDLPMESVSLPVVKGTTEETKLGNNI